MATLKGLSTRLHQRAVRIPKDAVRAKKIYAKHLLNFLLGGTPVDTSRAISNWRVSLGDWPTFESIEPHFMGILGSTAAQSAGRARRLGLSVISKAQPGVPISVFNNVYYVPLLNAIHPIAEGWIDVAPSLAMRHAHVEWTAKGVFRGRAR